MIDALRAVLVERGRHFLTDEELELVRAGALDERTARVMLSLELSTDGGQLAAAFGALRSLLPPAAPPTVADARALADRLGLRQVILATWDGREAHLVSYGRTPEDAAQAAGGSVRIQAALGWPDAAAKNPPRVQDLLDRIAELEARLAGQEAARHHEVFAVPATVGGEPAGWRVFADHEPARAWCSSPGAAGEPSPAGAVRTAWCSARVLAAVEAAAAGLPVGSLEDLLHP
jgi:hypothetical protein